MHSYMRVVLNYIDKFRYRISSGSVCKDSSFDNEPCPPSVLPPPLDIARILFVRSGFTATEPGCAADRILLTTVPHEALRILFLVPLRVTILVVICEKVCIIINLELAWEVTVSVSKVAVGLCITGSL
jgi:hypothetical protein